MINFPYYVTHSTLQDVFTKILVTENTLLTLAKGVEFWDVLHANLKNFS